MGDVLIRGVPDGVVAAIDTKADRLGLSRTEYLRRQMMRIAGSSDDQVTVAALRHFGEAFPDLDDSELMREAWE